MSKKFELTERNLEFKRDTSKYLLTKYLSKKYIDYRSDILDVFIYRSEKRTNRIKKVKKVLTTKRSKV